MLRVRELRSTDAQGLIALGQRLFALEDEIFGFSTETIHKELTQYRFARIVRKLTRKTDRKFYVAEVEGVPVGTTMVNRIGKAWYISTVMVHPDYQGRGLGRRLLEQACSEAREFGAKRVILHVRLGSTAAKALYASLGFQDFEREVYYARDSEDAVQEPLPRGYGLREIDRFDKRGIALADACREDASASVYGETARPLFVERLLWRLLFSGRFERFVVTVDHAWVGLYSLFVPSKREAARLQVNVLRGHRGAFERPLLRRALKRSYELGAPRLVISLDERREELVKACNDLGFKKVFEADGMVKLLS